jgi:hypothetical protein
MVNPVIDTTSVTILPETLPVPFSSRIVRTDPDYPKAYKKRKGKKKKKKKEVGARRR